MNDRTLGYFCIIIPAIIIIIAIGYTYVNMPSSGESRIIEIKGVSGLSFINIQDPVLIQGVQVGEIESITQNKENCLISIHSKQPLTIYSNYSITIGAQGVMGDRFLNIDPGNRSEKEIPLDEKLYGILLPSPPEAIAKMEQLLTNVRELQTISNELLYGSKNRQSFISTYNKTLSGFDTAISLISNKSTGISKDFDSLFVTIQNLVDRSLLLTNSMHTIIPTMLQKTDTLLASSAHIADQLSHLLTECENIVRLYNEKDYSDLNEFISKTQSSACSLQVIIKNIRDQGMYLPVRLW